MGDSQQNQNSGALNRLTRPERLQPEAAVDYNSLESFSEVETSQMMIAVIDGIGGGIGAQIVERFAWKAFAT